MMGNLVYNSLHSALMPLGEINTFYPEGLALKPSFVLVDVDAVKLTERLRPVFFQEKIPAAAEANGHSCSHNK